MGRKAGERLKKAGRRCSPPSKKSTTRPAMSDSQKPTTSQPGVSAAKGNAESANSAGRKHHSVPLHDVHPVEKVKEKAHGTSTVHGHQMDTANIFKLCGLIAFFVLDGGNRMVDLALYWHAVRAGRAGEGPFTEVRDNGVVGVLMLLGLQFLQIARWPLSPVKPCRWRPARCMALGWERWWCWWAACSPVPSCFCWSGQTWCAICECHGAGEVHR